MPVLHAGRLGAFRRRRAALAQHLRQTGSLCGLLIASDLCPSSIERRCRDQRVGLILSSFHQLWSGGPIHSSVSLPKKAIAEPPHTELSRSDREAEPEMLLSLNSGAGLLTHQGCLNGLVQPNASQTSRDLEHYETYTDAHYGIFSVRGGIKGNSKCFPAGIFKCFSSSSETCAGLFQLMTDLSSKCCSR